MVIYLKPIAAKFEENPSIGIGCISSGHVNGGGRTDRPTDRRTDATKRIHYNLPHDKSV